MDLFGWTDDITLKDGTATDGVEGAERILTLPTGKGWVSSTHPRLDDLTKREVIDMEGVQELDGTGWTSKNATPHRQTLPF
ncbi:MAG: hypothetical protein H7835_14120 [Magnetococcus sp. XQGC-1]